MIPKNKEELRKLVTEVTLDTYEDLTPQLIYLLNQTKQNPDLTEGQKTDEILLDMVGYVKSCTNEIIIEVLSRILDVKDAVEEEGNQENPLT